MPERFRRRATSRQPLSILSPFLFLGLAAIAQGAESQPAADPLAAVRAHEAARVAVFDRVAPSVVCIFGEDRSGGGSGVLITADGYGLTNFHVVAGMMKTRTGLGGLNDGRLYPLEVLGIDPTGDVAMFRLKDRERFEPAPLGDSDAVHTGDWVFAMGNPFLLAEDYTPTVTHGIVSGTHRYQFGASGRTLVYTDCIQVDASINPGNSGGPLFNMAGEVIGINGRASFEDRGRVNVGAGYAISINQIKRFIPGLRAGLLTEHGSLGAVTIDTGYHQVVFEKLLEPSVATAAGIDVGDRLRRFAGREIHSSNQFANILGVYPNNWPVDVAYEHEGKLRMRRVRLERLPVPSDEDFKVDEKLNRTEARRVLEACHQILGSPETAPGLNWRARRMHVRAEAEGIRPPELLDVHESTDGVGRCVVSDARGTPLHEFNYNGRTAEMTEAGSAAIDAGKPATRRINLWLAARRALFRPLDDDALERWRHLGGDGYNDRVVHMLEYNADDTPDLRVSIDLDSGLPVRVMWKPLDAPSESDPEIELELEDYRDVGGLRLPHRFRMYAGGEPLYMDAVIGYQPEATP